MRTDYDGSGGFNYIRWAYGVPAKRMARVRFEGQLGTVTGTDGPHLVVRPDERRYKGTRWLLHPTWHVEYLDAAGGVIWTKEPRQ